MSIVILQTFLLEMLHELYSFYRLEEQISFMQDTQSISIHFWWGLLPFRFQAALSDFLNLQNRAYIDTVPWTRECQFGFKIRFNKKGKKKKILNRPMSKLRCFDEKELGFLYESFVYTWENRVFMIRDSDLLPWTPVFLVSEPEITQA